MNPVFKRASEAKKTKPLEFLGYWRIGLGMA